MPYFLVFYNGSEREEKLIVLLQYIIAKLICTHLVQTKKKATQGSRSVLIATIWCVLLLDGCGYLVLIEWPIASLLIRGRITIIASSTEAAVLIESTTKSVLLLLLLA